MPDVNVPLAALVRLRGCKHFGESWPLASSLSMASHGSRRVGPAQLAQTHAVGAAHLQVSSLSLRSASVMSENLQVPPKALKQTLQILSSAVMHCTVAAQWKLQELIRTCIPPRGRVLFVESMRYDETPMQVRTSGATSTDLSLPTAPQSTELRTSGVAPTSKSLSQWTPALCEKATTTSLYLNILRTESCFVAFVEHDGTLSAFLSDVICPL